ncbi:hypothetical protein ODR04_24815, partial [Escherichia coli]|nr:hypothetical protein [Escherichia coli]
LPGSLQGKISSDGCLKKEQMVVSAIASTPHGASFFRGNKTRYFFYLPATMPLFCSVLRIYIILK